MTDHQTRAEALRSRIGSPVGLTDPELRWQVAARAAGGPPVSEPFDALARQIGEAACRVTDSQVTAVRRATDSDKATFEIIMCAAVGAGLYRWDSATRALREAVDAAV